jgi:hypothetical protein
MDIQPGDQVLVNLSPFIGSVMPSKESIPCVVLGSDGVQVQVRTEPPYREVTLWVLSTWVNGKAKQKAGLLAGRR